jgi:transposase
MALALENFCTISRLEMEERRMNAAAMFRRGASQAEVARVLGVTRTSASRWHSAFQAGKDMKLRKAPGRPCRLSGEQLRSLYSLWETRSKWTDAQFAEAVRIETGVKYDPDHVGRIVRRLGLRQTRGYHRETPREAA